MVVVAAIDLSTGRVFAAVVALIVLAFLAVWLIPQRQSRRWEAAGVSGKELADIENSLRGTIVQVIGGLALLLTFAATWMQISDAREATERTLRLTASQQVEERFTRSVGQLGLATPEGRLGGIYGLEGVGRESTQHRTPVVQILLAYLRSRHRVEGEFVEQHAPAQPVCDVPTDRFLAEDRQAALSAVMLLSNTNSRRNLTRTNLSFTRSPGGNFARIDLADSDLFYARLENARFDRANLIRTYFGRACLQGASFKNTIEAREANFEGADLRGADLSGMDLLLTSFRWAELRGANLRGANLASARVSKAQVREATTDACTRLPWRPDVPASCSP